MREPWPSHTLKSTVETVHWGYFDAAVAPVLTVEPGDRVTIETLSGAPDVMPPPGSGFALPPELPEIHAKVPRKLPGHLLTGPVAVKGAMPGDALEVDIEAIELRQDWGYNAIRPLSGALPGEFDEVRIVHIPLDHRQEGRHAVVGRRSAVASVLRRDGCSAAAGLGHGLVPAAQQARRQSRQQGAGRRHQTDPARACRPAPISPAATATARKVTARSA